MVAADSAQPQSPHPSFQPALNGSKVWLKASCQAHGLRESLGSHGGLDGRGCDASKCVSLVASGRRQIPWGSLVSGSASTLPTGHADPGLPTPSWPVLCVWGPREEGLIVQVWVQTSAVGTFSGLKREFGPRGRVNRPCSWEELP